MCMKVLPFVYCLHGPFKLKRGIKAALSTGIIIIKLPTYFRSSHSLMLAQYSVRILQFWRWRVLLIKKLRFNLSLGVNASLKTLDRSWPIDCGVHFESIAPPSKRIFPLWEMWGVAWKDITKNCFFPPFSLKFRRERLFVECTDNTIHV